MKIKVNIILLFLMIPVSTCIGQIKTEKLTKFEIDTIQNSNSGIQIKQFKLTLSDSWFGKDKAHHFLTSAFLSGIGYYFLHEEHNFPNRISQQGGFCFSVSLGLMKEIRDGLKPKNAFSVKDLVADLLGTTVGILLVSDL